MADDTDDGFSVDTLNLARCAAVNFGHLAIMPRVHDSPYFKIAMQQLNAVIKRLESDDAG